MLDYLNFKNDQVPIWLMRQAGRYLPEYQKIRQKHPFMEMVKTPELAAEITLQPIHRFDLDGAIIFSDILVIPEAMGMKLDFIDGEGPKFESSVMDLPAEITQCRLNDVMERLGFVFKATSLVKKELTQKNPRKISLIGFSGAPFTLAAYMIEGGSSKNFVRTKTFMLDDPQGFGQLLDHLTDLVIAYLKEQVQAGAQLVQVFDSWAGVLSPLDYTQSVLAANQKIFRELNPLVPTIYYSNSTSSMMDNLTSVGAQILSVDWRIDLSRAIQCVSDSGPKMGLQGNLDPTVLFAGKNCIEEKAKQILKEGKNAHRHVFNLGHGILPGTPISAVETLIDTVHSYFS